MTAIIAPRWLDIERTRMIREADATRAPQANLNADRLAREADFRAPQERINRRQIEADELAEYWLARNSLRVMAALMLLVLAAVTAARAGDYVARKTAADLALYHQFRSMK